MADEIVAAKLRQLADRFLTGLPADLAQMRGAMAGDDAAGAAGEAGGLLHRIAGRAGTFGFPRISEQASKLEALVLDGGWLEAGRPGAAFAAGVGVLETLCVEAIEVQAIEVQAMEVRP
jgi:HPt (histidine-containing phosphotransfer) domain-containing protein